MKDKKKAVNVQIILRKKKYIYIQRLFTLFKECINSGSELLSNNLLLGCQL